VFNTAQLVPAASAGSFFRYSCINSHFT